MFSNMIKFDEDKQNQKIRELRIQEEEQSAQLFADRYGTLYIDLTRVPINTDALRLVPEPEARETNLLCSTLLDVKFQSQYTLLLMKKQHSLLKF